jgi:hypothetical protein
MFDMFVVIVPHVVVINGVALLGLPCHSGRTCMVTYFWYGTYWCSVSNYCLLRSGFKGLNGAWTLARQVLRCLTSP